MQRKSTWVKQGNFAVSNTWDAPRHEVSYLNTDENAKLSSIRITGYDNGRKGFFIFAKNQETLESIFKNEFKFLKCYFHIYMSTYIGIDAVNDINALAVALHIIDGVANFEEKKKEIESILGINQRAEKSDAEECIQIKKSLYSKLGFAFAGFTLTLNKPPMFSEISNDLFIIKQKDGKELSVAMSQKKIAEMVRLLKEKDEEGLIKLFGRIEFDIGHALKNHSISEPEPCNEDNEHVMRMRTERSRRNI